MHKNCCFFVTREYCHNLFSVSGEMRRHVIRIPLWRPTFGMTIYLQYENIGGYFWTLFWTKRKIWKNKF